MLKIDDSLLNDLGLADLPPQERKVLLDQIIETLELRVGMKLAKKLSDEQLDEFESLLPTPADSVDVQKQKEASALSWLEANFPNYKDVVTSELETLKAEIKNDAHKILEAANPSQESQA